MSGTSNRCIFDLVRKQIKRMIVTDRTEIALPIFRVIQWLVFLSRIRHRDEERFQCGAYLRYIGRLLQHLVTVCQKQIPAATKQTDSRLHIELDLLVSNISGDEERK